MSKDARDRERLFDLYSRNHSLYPSEHPDTFRCPLCLKVFSRDALTAEPPVVSLAHVIPRSLGGKFVTLTCTRCNNDNGRAIEADLRERFRLEDWTAGVRQTGARLAGDFGSVGVEFAFDPAENCLDVQVVQGQSDPAHVEELKLSLLAAKYVPWRPVSVTIRGRLRHQPAKVEAAAYQSAYLLLFAYFGYEVVGLPAYWPLCDAVRSPGEAPTGLYRLAVVDEDSFRGGLDGRGYAVAVLKDPRLILAVLRFQPEGGRSRVLCVALPGPEGGRTHQFRTRGKIDCDVLDYSPEMLATKPYLLGRTWDFLRRRDAA
jgi:hypothetical protein